MEIELFSDAEFMTAAEKLLVLKQWRTFLKALVVCDFTQVTGADYGYFPTSLDKPFTDRLCKHLSLHANFIAHYNRRGFLSARFGTLEDTQETIGQLRQAIVMADYRDLHQAMLRELQTNRISAFMATPAWPGGR